MEKNKAELFLNAMNEDEKIQAFMKDYTLPEGMEKEDALVEIARRFGYEITKEELLQASEARCKAIEAAGQAAKEAVEELSIDQLDMVAGGKKYNDDCNDTYKDKENCWLTDGCDVSYIGYSDYRCKRLYN